MWIYTSCYVCGRSNRVAEISFSASPNIPSSWAPDPCGAPENLEFLHSSSPPPSSWAPESCYADGPACSLSFFPFCCSSPLSFLFLTSRPYSLSPLLCVWEKFTEWPNFVSVFPTVSPPPPSSATVSKASPAMFPLDPNSHSCCILELELRPNLVFFSDCQLASGIVVTTPVLLVFILFIYFFLLLCYWLLPSLGCLTHTHYPSLLGVRPWGNGDMKRGHSMAAPQWHYNTGYAAYWRS